MSFSDTLQVEPFVIVPSGNYARSGPFFAVGKYVLGFLAIGEGATTFKAPSSQGLPIPLLTQGP